MIHVFYLPLFNTWNFAQYLIGLLFSIFQFGNKLFYCMYFFLSVHLLWDFFFFDKFINHRKQQRITPCAYPSETANVNIVSYLPRFLSDKTNISGKIAVSSSPAEARAGLCCPQAFLWLQRAGFSLRCFSLAAEHWLWGVRASGVVARGLSSAIPGL